GGAPAGNRRSPSAKRRHAFRSGLATSRPVRPAHGSCKRTTVVHLPAVSRRVVHSRDDGLRKRLAGVGGNLRYARGLAAPPRFDRHRRGGGFLGFFGSLRRRWVGGARPRRRRRPQYKRPPPAARRCPPVPHPPPHLA